MPYENFEYVVEKEKLPDFTNNSECPICLLPIDLENDCVICEYGHRMHNTCYFQMIDKRTCPICNGLVDKMCHGFNKKLGTDAFSYLPRKGGNYKKYKILKTVKRKYSSKSSKKNRKFTNKNKKNRKNKRTRYHKKN